MNNNFVCLMVDGGKNDLSAAVAKVLLSLLC
jgi:hypothetical protein